MSLVTKPDQSILLTSELNKRLGYTPDFHKLREREIIPVFVYDSLCKGFYNDYLLREAEYYGRAHTVRPEFSLREPLDTGTSWEADPVMFMHTESTADSCIVVGDLYGVSYKHVHMLDRVFNTVGGRSFRWQVHVAARDQESPQGFPLARAFTWLGSERYYSCVRMRYLRRTSNPQHKNPLVRNLTGYEYL